ncbi:unnamed protein product [Caenorhabditis brenneri]
MRTLIALCLWALIEPGGLEKPESTCKWYVNKLTPGPIGTNVKLIGSRKTLEYIELQSDCEKPVYSNLMVLVVQSFVPVGLSKSYPTPMPTIIAHYNFGGLRAVDVKSNGKRHTILIGRQHVGKSDFQFSIPGYSIRSKCSTCIFKDQLTAGSLLWDSQQWQNYDPKRVFYSIHVMDRRWVVYDGQEEYNADKIKYAEFESCRKTEIRRIDSFLADIIRQKQMDAVIFAPKYVKWDIDKPFSRMFVSEYSMAMFQALEDDGLNRRPRVVWYDPNEEKPLILCSKTDDTTTSYGFQQVTAEPTDENEKVCGNEWLDLTDLVPSPKLLFKGQSSSKKENNSEWRETEIKLLSHYGLMYSSGGVYKPFDKHISFFGSSAFPMLTRFEAEKSEEVKPKLSDESRIEALRFAQHADELKNDDGLNGKSSTDQLKDIQYTPLRSSAQYEDELKKLLDYVTDDTEVMPSLSKKTTTTPDPNAATTGSARLRALKFPNLKTAVEALDDSENPEKIDTKVKVPSFLSYYASVEWESFSLDQLVTDAKETVHKRKVDDEEEKFDYLQFEALNDRFITDVMTQGSKNIYTHNKWNPRFVSDNWFGNDANKRKSAVMDSMESLKTTFQLGHNFITQYETFIDNLADCLSSRQQQLVLKRQHMLWSTILNTPKCVPSLDSDLRDAIFAMLALPGSTAQVERAFSIVFHTRGPRRSRMNVETLNAILSVRLNVGRVENMDVPEFVRYWSTDNSMLAHSNSLYENSELFNFKQKLVNDVATTDAQDMEESEDIFDIYDEFVPRVEHIKETSAQQELNLISDRYIAGEKQTRLK